MNPQDQGFTKVVGAQPASGEGISSPLLVSCAYAFIWLVVLFYVLTLWRRGRTTEREIDDLRRKLAAK
jgi:CcmD family protein